MKKGLRYHASIALSKLLKQGVKLIGRSSSHTIGSIALKADPDLLKHLPKIPHRIAITGTNGKTSVSNTVAGFLKKKGIRYVNNGFGSNILQGVITALIDGVDLFGKGTVDYAVLEVDELASRFILPDYQPHYLAITNLFRDSYRRNAHVEFITRRLSQSIGDEVHLILNADDLISCGLKPNNLRTYFSIAPLEGEFSSSDDLINDLRICPQCEYPLHYDFQHYHHIGKVSCVQCGFTNPKADYEITHWTKDSFTLRYQKKDYVVPFDALSIANLYNVLVSIVVLHKLGFPLQEVLEHAAHPSIPKSRFNAEEVNGISIITLMGKDQNPVAVTRAFDTIRRYDASKNIGVIYINQEDDGPLEHENIAYIYDVNFEYLNQPNIKKIALASDRYLDIVARLELAGYPKKQILAKREEIDLIPELSIEGLDVIFLIPGTTTLKAYEIVKNHVIQLAKENDNHQID